MKSSFSVVSSVAFAGIAKRKGQFLLFPVLQNTDVLGPFIIEVLGVAQTTPTLLSTFHMHKVCCGWDQCSCDGPQSVENAQVEFRTTMGSTR